jgi:Skp family chaperone for outer membrane proteins
MKATIFLATALGIAIAGAALQAQAAPARIAEFGAAPEITLVAQARSSRAKPKVEAIKRKRSRSPRCFGGICPLVGSGDY